MVCGGVSFLMIHSLKKRWSMSTELRFKWPSQVSSRPSVGSV